MCICLLVSLVTCVYVWVFGDGREKHAHPLDVELHVLLSAALDLLLHFSHRRLHIYDALFGDADGENWEDGV